MGLDISGAKSDKSYHAGYSGLHKIRHLAMLACGFPPVFGDKESRAIYPTCHVVPSNIEAKHINEALWAAMLAGHHYPNLMLHSDCDGTYTRTGKVNANCPGGWMTGNSVALLAELEDIKAKLEDKHKIGNSWDLFTMFYDLVKDEVENGAGELDFH